MNTNSLGNSARAFNATDASVPNGQSIIHSTESLFSLRPSQAVMPNINEFPLGNALSMMATSSPSSPALLRNLISLDLESEKIARQADEISKLPEGNFSFGLVLKHHSELLQWSASAQLLSSTTKSLQDGLQQLFKNS